MVPWRSRSTLLVVPACMEPRSPQPLRRIDISTRPVDLGNSKRLLQAVAGLMWKACPLLSVKVILTSRSTAVPPIGRNVPTQRQGVHADRQNSSGASRQSIVLAHEHPTNFVLPSWIGEKRLFWLPDQLIQKPKKLSSCTYHDHKHACVLRAWRQNQGPFVPQSVSQNRYLSASRPFQVQPHGDKPVPVTKSVARQSPCPLRSTIRSRGRLGFQILPGQFKEFDEDLVWFWLSQCHSCLLSSRLE